MTYQEFLENNQTDVDDDLDCMTIGSQSFALIPEDGKTSVTDKSEKIVFPEKIK